MSNSTDILASYLSLFNTPTLASIVDKLGKLQHGFLQEGKEEMKKAVGSGTDIGP